MTGSSECGLVQSRVPHRGLHDAGELVERIPLLEQTGSYPSDAVNGLKGLMVTA